MSRVISLVFICLAVALLSPAAAAAGGKRIALVVGNSAYRNISPLANSANDARLIADTLRSLDFNLVGGAPQLDLNKSQFDEAVQSFGNMLGGTEVALFYYAGHGLQVRGNNYLVPVNASPVREADVDFQLLDVAVVLRQMQGSGARLNLVILDACRNNPFGASGLRAASGGLAQMQAPDGTLISYATQPGNVALDGHGRNSPFTEALAATIRRPGLDIFQTFNEVGLQVKRATDGAQVPWVSSSPIDGSFYFTAAVPQGPQAAPALAAPMVQPKNPVIEWRPDADIFVSLGETEAANGHHDKAAAAYGQAIEIDARNWKARIGRGTAYAAMKDNDRALTDFDAAIGLAPAAAAPYLGRGRILALKGYWDRALDDFKKSIELDPNDARAYSLRARVYIRNYSLILTDLVGAALFGANGKGWDDFAAKYRENDEGRLLKPYYQLALADLNKAITLNPNSANDYLTRGNTYLVRNRSDNAADLARSVDAEMKKNTGSVFGLVPDPDRAIADFSKTIALEPKSFEAYRGRAWALFKAGRPAQGLPDANRAIELAPNDANAIEMRGLIYEALAKTPEAIADYRNALKLKGGDDSLNKTRLRRLGAAP
jgi:tetratricopeptide (TPR) repeat protein